MISENRASSSGSAAADFVSVLARGSGTDVICTDSGSLVFAAAAAAAAASRAARAPFYLLQLPGVLDLPFSAETSEVTLQYDN